MRIGIMALQGAFIEHQKMLDQLGIESFEIRNLHDFSQPMNGLILPGGESTAMGKLLIELQMFNPLKKRIEEGLPVFGTCAGLILLATEIEDQEHNYLQTLNISVKRNAYGRQLGSFRTIETFKGIGDIPMVFIRAPYILSTGEGVEALATHQDKIIAARKKHQLVTAFHPELSGDTSIHRYFVEMIKQSKYS